MQVYSIPINICLVVIKRNSLWFIHIHVLLDVHLISVVFLKEWEGLITFIIMKPTSFIFTLNSCTFLTKFFVRREAVVEVSLYYPSINVQVSFEFCLTHVHKERWSAGRRIHTGVIGKIPHTIHTQRRSSNRHHTHIYRGDWQVDIYTHAEVISEWILHNDIWLSSFIFSFSL